LLLAFDLRISLFCPLLSADLYFVCFEAQLVLSFVVCRLDFLLLVSVLVPVAVCSSGLVAVVYSLVENFSSSFFMNVVNC
jgi:hypothetical protein